jgi:type III restriction enzyme
LVMAGSMLYLYQKGYRNFLFFVKSTNILDKTKENFVNPASSKYLFGERIEIDGKEITIRAVDNFQFGASDDINIAFTTTQGLYAALKKPKENGLTLDDFKDHKMVLIADEAHSLSAETKKGNQIVIDFDNLDNPDDLQSWEGAVKRIFSANNQNLLLDFTATANLDHPEIAKKYHDKLLFDYPLKQFRKEGYSKEVEIVQVDEEPMQRALIAVLLSQYRLKLFGQYVKPIKPVVMFKTHKIEENKIFHEKFISCIKQLKGDDLEKLNVDNADPIIKTMFKYFADNTISMANLASEIKTDFAEEKLLMVNDDKETEKMQISLNTLEETGNEYRGIFAVNKLDEGWDVLNLFDIVRVSHKRDASNNIPGKGTVSEAQLIGRGARYCPFILDVKKHGAETFVGLKDPQEIDKRKFDDNISHSLRICETMYYHSLKDTRYISELKNALDDIGIKDKNTVPITIYLKPQFKDSDFYKQGLLWVNEQTPVDNGVVSGFEGLDIIKDYPFSLSTGSSKSMIAFSDDTPSVSIEEEGKPRPFKLYDDFGGTIVRKAMNKLAAFSFDNLQRYFPKLKSTTEFISSDAYFRGVRAFVKGRKTHLDNLSADDKLRITISVLQQISLKLGEDKTTYKGTEVFRSLPLRSKIFEKTINVEQFSSRAKEQNDIGVPTDEKLDVSKRDWFVFDRHHGTPEERSFVKFFDERLIEDLEKHFENVYLVRNERQFKIYSFDEGNVFEPDFLLFVSRTEGDIKKHWQVFIEPKGDGFIIGDEWKEAFMLQMKERHQINEIHKGKKYSVWGMPFYNDKQEKKEGTFGHAFAEFVK